MKTNTLYPVDMVKLALLRKLPEFSSLRVYRNALACLPHPVPSGLYLCQNCSNGASQRTRGDLIEELFECPACHVRRTTCHWLSAVQKKLLEVLPPGAVIREVGMVAHVLPAEREALVLCEGCRKGALHTAALREVQFPRPAGTEQRTPAATPSEASVQIVEPTVQAASAVRREYSEVVLDGGNGNWPLPRNEVEQTSRAVELTTRQVREAEVCEVLTRVVDQVTAMVKDKGRSSSSSNR